MQTRAVGLSDQIRSIAKNKYVNPAVRSGRTEFSIPVRDLMGLAEADGISTIQKVPAFCTSIMKEAFLHENHLEIVSVDGPASKRSTTVVVHYRVRGKNGLAQGDKGINLSETAAQRAQRLTAKLRGLMKDEITAHGGAEGFLRWVRSDEDEV